MTARRWTLVLATCASALVGCDTILGITSHGLAPAGAGGSTSVASSMSASSSARSSSLSSAANGSSSSTTSGGPTCADVDGAVGCCDANGDLEFCTDGSHVLKQSCDGTGCGWSSVSGFYACGGTGADPSGTHPLACMSSGAGGSSSSCPTHIVITEVQTRGAQGGLDEFISLYNPTAHAITLGSSWSISFSNENAIKSTVWVGTSGFIPAHGFYLIVGPTFGGTPTPDANTSATVSDAGMLVLLESTSTVDSLCYAYDAQTLTAVSALGCPGTPAMNDHDDTSGSNVDESLARKPLDCTDTGDSSKDFAVQNPSTPRNSTTPPVVYP